MSVKIHYNDLTMDESRCPRLQLGQYEDVIPPPNLVKIQLDSYREFLQPNTPPEKLLDQGLHAALSSVFPIKSSAGHVELTYEYYVLGRSLYNLRECLIKGISYAVPVRAKLKLITREKENLDKIIDIKEQMVYLGDLPLMTETGSFVINGTERVVVSQMHQSPGVSFVHDKGKTHSSGKLLYSARIIPYRGAWLDFEFDSKNILNIRIDRRRKLPVTLLLKALGLNADDILKEFYTNEIYTIKGQQVLQPIDWDSVGGLICPVDLKDKKGKVIIAKGRRFNARHIKLCKEAGISSFDLELDALLKKIVAKPVIDADTGEILVDANTIIDQEVLSKIVDMKLETIELLKVDQLNHG